MSGVVVSALDSRLLGLARRPYSEIAETLGVDAGWVAERLGVLLTSEGVLSDRQEERLLLLEVVALKDEVVSRMRSAEDRDFASVANVALRALKLIGERLDGRQKLVQADINEISAAQAKLFGRAFDRALVHIVGEFKGAEVLPDAEIIDAIVADGLRLAVREVESSVVS